MTVRLGIMGGTFDPIHTVHLMKAGQAAHGLALDEVVFVPAGRPRHKRPHADAESRYEMTRLAVAADPRFSASRIEIDRAGVSFTVDTLRELRSLYRFRAELYFIAGADTLRSLATWREPLALADLAHFVFCSRAGHESATTTLPLRMSFLRSPPWEVSSTTIRRRIRRGLPIRYLVPDPVADFIAARGLYLRSAS